MHPINIYQSIKSFWSEMKILIMHSDKKFADAITDGLTVTQYHIHYAADGEDEF